MIEDFAQEDVSVYRRSFDCRFHAQLAQGLSWRILPFNCLVVLCKKHVNTCWTFHYRARSFNALRKKDAAFCVIDGSSNLNLSQNNRIPNECSVTLTTTNNTHVSSCGLLAPRTNSITVLSDVWRTVVIWAAGMKISTFLLLLS